MDIFGKLLSQSSKRIRKSSRTLVDTMSFGTLDHRIAFDAAGLDLPIQELASDGVISEVRQPQARIDFPSSSNKIIGQINFTTDELNGKKVNLPDANFELTSVVNAKLTNTDRAFADLSWLSLASTDTPDQDMASSDSAAKDKFATILSEFSDH